MFAVVKNKLYKRGSGFIKESWPLFLIIFVGIVLRLYGLNHGFPFIFHPDEPAVVRSATGIRFDPNPAHFDWPHLHFYLNFFLYWLFIKFRGFLQIIGLQEPIVKIFPLLWRDPLVFYWLSRLFDAFLGAFTALPLYLAGKELFNKKTGLLAALAISVMPFHVHVSHFALIDVPTAFWISWAIYFSTKIYRYGLIKNYLLAGFFIGLAASTKYNGGLAALVVFMGHLIRLIESAEEGIKRKTLDTLKQLLNPKEIKFLVVSGFAAIAGFILGTPYSVLDFDTFIRSDSPVGAMWQFKNVGSVDFAVRINQFIRVLTTEYLNNFGYTLIIIFTLFAIYSTFKMNKKVCFIYVPALFLFYYTAGFDKLRAHYFLTVYPFVALAVGVAIEKVIRNKSKVFKVFVLLAVFLPPLMLSAQRSVLLKKEDTRNITYNWLKEHVTIADFLIYNSSSLNPVVEKFSKDRLDKGVNKENLEGKKGYIVMYVDDMSEMEDGEVEESGATDEWDVISGYEEVFRVDSKGRRGENVLIYHFDERILIPVY